MQPQIDEEITMEAVLDFVRSQHDDVLQILKREKDSDNVSYYQGQESAYALIAALIVK